MSQVLADSLYASERSHYNNKKMKESKVFIFQLDKLRSNKTKEVKKSFKQKQRKIFLKLTIFQHKINIIFFIP